MHKCINHCRCEPPNTSDYQKAMAFVKSFASEKSLTFEYVYESSAYCTRNIWYPRGQTSSNTNTAGPVTRSMSARHTDGRYGSGELDITIHATADISGPISSYGIEEKYGNCAIVFEPMPELCNADAIAHVFSCIRGGDSNVINIGPFKLIAVPEPDTAIHSLMKCMPYRDLLEGYRVDSKYVVYNVSKREYVNRFVVYLCKCKLAVEDSVDGVSDAGAIELVEPSYMAVVVELRPIYKDAIVAFNIAGYGKQNALLHAYYTTAGLQHSYIFDL
jgi:hypothetical protein